MVYGLCTKVSFECAIVETRNDKTVLNDLYMKKYLKLQRSVIFVELIEPQNHIGADDTSRASGAPRYF